MSEHVVEHKPRSSTRDVGEPSKRASTESRWIPNLSEQDENMLLAAGISRDVIRERGYKTLRRTNTDNAPRDALRILGFSSSLYSDDARFPGLLMPLYGPRGQHAGSMYRPMRPRKDKRGRPRKYELPQGRPAVLDVHPRNRDRVADPTVPLWITEGVKKGDCLTSHGQCVVTLSGVFNWRNGHGTLGDWEDIPLRGRTVIIAFDADAKSNRNVARAMRRLGAWLRSKGAKVLYVVCPELEDSPKTGVDDFLAAGGTVEQLLAVAKTTPPDPGTGDASFTDSRLAERVADERLRGSWRFCRQLGGWLLYEDGIWTPRPSEEVIEEVRLYLKQLHHDELEAGGDPSRLAQLARIHTRSRIEAIAYLCRGMEDILTDPLAFDEDPWLLCAGNGVVDLRSGELLDHDPDLLMLRRTPVNYIKNAQHADWRKALLAFPDDETRAWAQVVLGTGAVGLPATRDEMYLWLGQGANGKTTVIGACRFALGDYAKVVPANLLGGTNPGHPTVKMELFGLRLAVVEELQEGHMLDEARVKEITGAFEITAYKMRQDPVTFSPSHTLIVSSNHTPKVKGTDFGIWRRLAAVPFPIIFSGISADPGLRERLRTGKKQQEAVLAWLIEGAVAYWNAGQQLPSPPQSVKERTTEWREDADTLLAWITAHFVYQPGAEIETEELLEEFNAYLERQPGSSYAWSSKTFVERLKGHDVLQRYGVVVERSRKPHRRSTVFGLRRMNRSDPGWER